MWFFVSVYLVITIESFILAKSLLAAADMETRKKKKKKEELVLWVYNLVETFINQGFISIYGEAYSYEKLELFSWGSEDWCEIDPAANNHCKVWGENKKHPKAWESKQKQSDSGQGLTLKRRKCLRLISHSYGFKVRSQLALFTKAKILLEKSQSLWPEEWERRV